MARPAELEGSLCLGSEAPPEIFSSFFLILYNNKKQIINNWDDGHDTIKSFESLNKRCHARMDPAAVEDPGEEKYPAAANGPGEGDCPAPADGPGDGDCLAAVDGPGEEKCPAAANGPGEEERARADEGLEEAVAGPSRDSCSENGELGSLKSAIAAIRTMHDFNRTYFTA